MKFRPAIWYPIATVLSVANVASVWFAAQEAEPAHATIHAVLALAFGLWAQRLRMRASGSELQAGLEAVEAFRALEGEVGTLRQALSETQERLDFSERLLAQNADDRRADRPGTASR